MGSSSIAAFKKPNPVVQRLLVFSVDAFDGHHRHQDMFLFDQARCGKQQFDKNGLSATTTYGQSGARDISARQVAFIVHQLVNLCDDDAIVERAAPPALGYLRYLPRCRDCLCGLLNPAISATFGERST